jgi:hypothetical protein
VSWPVDTFNKLTDRSTIGHKGVVGNSEYFSEYYSEENPHFHFAAKTPDKHLKSFIRVLEDEWSGKFECQSRMDGEQANGTCINYAGHWHQGAGLQFTGYQS